MTSFKPDAKSVFGRAAEIASPADRAAFLDDALAGHPTVRVEVEMLLKAHGDAGSFMGFPAAPAGETAEFDAPIAEGEGTVVGPYTLREQIGEGGMGLVFVAEQTQPVRRKVALKVIKPGMDTKQVVARFEAERQALAMMDHPHIARVLDAGTTASGRPFFVMELVRGVPITEYCDANNLSPRDRLGLFVQVCQAVQHAHQKGVIHRDLKPTNILVAPHDGVPVVKVIDFGVAKALGQSLTEKTIYTRFAQMVGTPLYMSPEQAEVNQLDVDTRSDVYALGVLLYELLTGTTPFDGDRFRKAAFDEIRRIIREEEPPRPSTRLTTLGATLTSVSAKRGTDPGRLSALVRGELDWIVMRCLEKERTRRYDTATALAKDVQRYLAGDAVEACPPTLAYRLKKAYRRNQAVLTTAGVVVAALLVGTTVSVWQAVAANHAQSVAIAERDEKEKARETAEKAVDETKAANEKLRLTYDQQQRDQYAWDVRGLHRIWESGNALEARRLLEKQPEILRGFEWHYWDRQTHAERLSTKLSFEVTPRQAAEWTFSGDGTRLALVQSSGSSGFETPKVEPKDQEMILTVWDLATRNVVRTHRFAGPEYSVRFRDNNRVQLSRDGKRVQLSQTLTSGNDRDGFIATGTRVEVFDVDSGKVIRSLRFEKESPYRVHANVRFTRDGRKLIAAVQTREPAASEQMFAPGKLVSSEIQVFDLDAGDREPLMIPDAGFRALSEDGSRIVSARHLPTDATFLPVPRSEPREHTIWDTETGKELARFELSGVSVLHTAGKELFAVVVADGQKSDKLLLKSWSMETGKERLSVPLPFPASPIRTTNPKGGGPENLYIPSAFVVFDRDGKNLLVGKSPGGPVRSDLNSVTVIDSQTGKISTTVNDLISGRMTIDVGMGPGGPRNMNPRRPFFTADGKQFIVSDDNVIRTFDSLTGKLTHTLRGHENEIAAQVEGPDGKLWSVEADGTLKQWDLQPPEPVRLGTKLTNSVGSTPFAMSANGAKVARVHVEKVDMKDEYKSIVEVWDTAGKEQAKVFQKVGVLRGPASQFGLGGRRDSTEVALSADGRRVALLRPAAYPPLAKDEKIDPANPRKPTTPADLTVWDVAGGEEIYHTEISDPPGLDPRYWRYSQPTFTPDGSTVIIVLHAGLKQYLRVFDVQNRREGPSIEFGTDPLQAPLFSPDRKQVAALKSLGRQANEVQVYEVATGKRRTIDARVGPVNRMAWSPDGKRLLVTYQSGTAYEINIYDVATGKLSASLYTADQLGSQEMWYSSVFSTGPVFSPDGRRVASVASTRQSGFIKVWDAESGKDLLTIPLAPTSATGSRGLYHLAFTSDNHKLVAVKTQDLLGGPGFGDTTTLITVTTYDATPREAEKK